MMEFLAFTFQSAWHFCGVTLLLLIAAQFVGQTVRALSIAFLFFWNERKRRHEKEAGSITITNGEGYPLVTDSRFRRGH